MCDPDILAAAHRSLPFGTIVRVQNVSTGSDVVVRINDRGPFVDGRIIDLTKAAAEQLGIVDQGVAMIRLSVIQPAT
jgi:rare lipoprotein A